MKKTAVRRLYINRRLSCCTRRAKKYYKKLYSRSENKSNEEISDVFFDNPALTELNEDEKKQL